MRRMRPVARGLLAKMRAMSNLRWVWLVPLLCAVVSKGAAAEASQSVYLEELTSAEVREQVAAGRTVAIIPVGGTEQSGPHIVLGKHNVRVRVLAGRIAAALGKALVAPVVAYVPEGAIDPPAGHMRFAGTLSIPEGAFETLLEYACRSLRQHGFRDIVLVGDHGGYQKSLGKVAVRLNREWATGATRVHAIESYYRAADVDFANALRKQGYGDAEIGTHAGLADTALSLAVDPKLVRGQRMEGRIGVAEGVHGDPRRATAALGQQGVDLIVNHALDEIRRDLAQR